MDLRELHAPWRNGQEYTRSIEVQDGLAINVLLPAYYWSLWDSLDAEGWNMARCAQLCWFDAQDREVGPMWGGDYETFRRHLVAGILLYDDGRKGIEEGRDNDNQPHLAGAWLKRRQSDGTS